jgi:hypothetical protein
MNPRRTLRFDVLDRGSHAEAIALHDSPFDRQGLFPLTPLNMSTLDSTRFVPKIKTAPPIGVWEIKTRLQRTSSSIICCAEVSHRGRCGMNRPGVVKASTTLCSVTRG